MTGQARIDRLETRLAAAETLYRECLIGALEECASGRWGLFGHNGYTEENERFRPPAVGELQKLADEIDGLRAQLGQPPFPLHERFRAARGPQDANAPGEPKQARRWLDELAQTLPPRPPPPR